MVEHFQLVRWLEQKLMIMLPVQSINCSATAFSIVSVIGLPLSETELRPLA